MTRTDTNPAAALTDAQLAAAVDGLLKAIMSYPAGQAVPECILQTFGQFKREQSRRQSR